jgi:hypothetical protein
MAVSKAQLINLYLAYFGRPPDIDGLNFYTSNPQLTVQDITASFSASPESIALFGSTTGTAQINAIYQNLFNRDAEPAGLAYWLGEISALRISPAAAALSILQGAQNSDLTSVQNKVTVATNFLAQLDTAAEIIGYSGTNAAKLARDFLKTVDSTALSLATATAAVEKQVSIAAGITPAASPPAAPPPAVIGITLASYIATEPALLLADIITVGDTGANIG